MISSYFVNGIHIIDAYLCRQLIKYFITNLNENILTIHDSIGITINNKKIIKQLYMKLIELIFVKISKND